MDTNETKRIFLDYASATPIDPVVKKVMTKAEQKFWANSSSLHKEGEMAKEALEKARTEIARFLHCRASEVFFTSGGTESLNLAILGVVKNKIKPHIITSTIEHPAVLEPIRQLVKNREAEASFVMPDKNGIVNPESIKRELKDNTVLVAIQHANNEIGTIQSVRKIKEIIENWKKDNPTLQTLSPGGRGQEEGPVFLVDACQSVLYEDVSVERLGADLLVLDGIKMYGPRGTGVLVIKHGTGVSPVISGGGQEGGLRSGTENVIGAIGLAKALEIVIQKREKESARLLKLRDYTISEILKIFPEASLNGDKENRLPNNINVCFPKRDSEFLVIKLDTLGFAVSAASACHTLSLENSSFVIEALSKKECASSSLRITLGRDTKKRDLDKFIFTLKKIINK